MTAILPLMLGMALAGCDTGNGDEGQDTLRDEVVVDGRNVSNLINLESLSDGKGGYDFSKLDLTNVAIFKDGVEGAYLVTIGDKTTLVGNTTLKKWVGNWENWQDYIYPDAAMQERYPYLEGVWEIAYDAFKSATYPNLEALKDFWKGMTDTKGVDSFVVELNDNSEYVLSWVDENGGILYSGAYTMIGKMVNGLEGAIMYVFEADTISPGADSYQYLVAMEPDMEGDIAYPIAAHYHFQFGSMLSELLQNGLSYNGTGRNIKNAFWYATMINAAASDLAKYNVILAMHGAEKWSAVPGE
jgi:hypothetical protein